VQRPEDLSPERKRLLRRLAVVVDEHWPDRVRLAAVRAIQGMLSRDNPLRGAAAGGLLDTVKSSWGSRLEVVGGRAVERPVRRPPQSLSDLW
jgi:hypothetical protein